MCGKCRCTGVGSADVQVRRCADVQVCRCAGCRCVDVLMYWCVGSADVQLCRCVDAQVCRYAGVQVCGKHKC